MAAIKLNFRFHNPNTPEKTAEQLLKIFLEADANKAETAIKAAALVHNKESACK